MILILLTLYVHVLASIVCPSFCHVMYEDVLVLCVCVCVCPLYFVGGNLGEMHLVSIEWPVRVVINIINAYIVHVM